MTKSTVIWTKRRLESKNIDDGANVFHALLVTAAVIVNGQGVSSH